MFSSSFSIVLILSRVDVREAVAPECTMLTRICPVLGSFQCWTFRKPHSPQARQRRLRRTSGQPV
jgi:hypothetical protein